jgi:putative ABC transport system ATP-binding protein
VLGLGRDRDAEAPCRGSRGGLLSALVDVAGVSHYFGSGALRKQILHDVSLQVEPGEIVLLTGPSGSGKTTLLTLIGALRSTQEGSLTVFGQELRGASEALLVSVRRRIGYVFQQHNLLDALTVRDNVCMALRGETGLARSEAETRAVEMLDAVGLAEHAARYPDRLSGGQKQRVAIARALVGRPRIVLADEPTASLDKQAGRDVVSLIHDLAKRQGTAVLLVTHDNRILDIADRIVHLEEGRLADFADAVLANTQHMLGLLAQSNRKGGFVHQVRDLSPAAFAKLFDEVTTEARQFLQVIEMSNSDAFESMLEQVLEAFTMKIGQVVSADRASLFLLDEASGELWAKVAQFEGERAIDIRVPLGEGIAGRVIATGEPMNVPDAYANPYFKREIDEATGYHTRSLLCMPIFDRRGRPFAVTQLINKRSGGAFNAADEGAFREFAASIGVILEGWLQMSRGRRAAAG